MKKNNTKQKCVKSKRSNVWEKKKKKRVKIRTIQNFRISFCFCFVEENDATAAKNNDTLVERIQLAVIRNLELSIRNIHIVYEDQSTKPGHPFSMGITLNYITLHVRKQRRSFSMSFFYERTFFSFSDDNVRLETNGFNWRHAVDAQSNEKKFVDFSILKRTLFLFSSFSSVIWAP